MPRKVEVLSLLGDLSFEVELAVDHRLIATGRVSRDGFGRGELWDSILARK